MHRATPSAATTNSISLVIRNLDTIDRQLGLLDVGIQLGTRPDVEPPEMLEELPKVLDGRIPKHLGLAVV